MAVQDELFAAIDQVYDALNSAYWAASTIQDKDSIKGTLDVLDDLLMALNRAAFKDRTALLNAVGAKVDLAGKQLLKTKNEIDQIVRAVGVASQVVKAVDNAITTIARLAV